MNGFLFWLKNARYQSLPQSMLPAGLAVCMASQNDDFSWIYAVLAILGVASAHLGLNLFDDFFDYRKKGVDGREKLVRAGIRARIAKCSYLISGQTTLKRLFIAAASFCAFALTIGIAVFLKRGEGIAYFILIAAFLGFSYSGFPFYFSYKGLGEVIVAIMFGPLLMAGVFYASCGVLEPSVWLISIPVGLLVANILYTHSIMDLEPDKQVHKMTLAVLVNNKKWMLFFSFLFIFIPYAFVICGVVSGFLRPYSLLVLLTLPMAVSLFYLLIKFVDDPQKTYRPRFWMGPMENMNAIKVAGIDWFMLRWFLARNLVSFFCLIMGVVYFLN